MPQTTRSHSIRNRLIVLFTLQVLLIVLVGGIYLDWQVGQTLEDELGRKLERLASTAALQVDGELLQTMAPGDETTRTFRNLKLQLEALRKASDARRIYVFDSARRSLLDTDSSMTLGMTYAFLPVTQIEISGLATGASLSSPLFQGSDGRLYKTGFAPVSSNGRVIASLGLEASAQTLDAIQVVRRDMLFLGIVVLAGSIVLAIFFSSRLTTPLSTLKRAAEKIAAGDYDHPIRSASKDEIGFLGHTMEDMRRAIVQRDTRQKTMLAGVAHEIRNPLGGIELFAGLLASEVTDAQARQEAQKIQKEVQTLKKIVTDFLDYARPRTPRRESCSISGVLDEVKMLLAPELEKIEFILENEEQFPNVLIDPMHLKQVMLNLVKNSADAMAAEGTIRVSATSQGNTTEILFSDDGPGIAAELRPRIFEPFFTGRQQGTGLGLAIAKTLIEENGGTVRLRDGEPATFEICLPREN